MTPHHSLFTRASGSRTGQSAYHFLSLWLVLSSAAETLQVIRRGALPGGPQVLFLSWLSYFAPWPGPSCLGCMGGSGRAEWHHSPVQEGLLLLRDELLGFCVHACLEKRKWLCAVP